MPLITLFATANVGAMCEEENVSEPSRESRVADSCLDIRRGAGTRGHVARWRKCKVHGKQMVELDFYSGDAAEWRSRRNQAKKSGLVERGSLAQRKVVCSFRLKSDRQSSDVRVFRSTHWVFPY